MPLFETKFIVHGLLAIQLGFNRERILIGEGSLDCAGANQTASKKYDA